MKETCPVCGAQVPDQYEGVTKAIRFTSFAVGVFLVGMGLVVLASEVGWALVHAFGFHGAGEHEAHQIFGMWNSLFFGVAALVLGMTFMMGAPGQAGHEILEGIAGFFGRFSPGRGD